MSTLKLKPLALGLSMGILWGVYVLLMGLVAAFYAYGKPFVAAVGGLYIGYEPTIVGSIIGGAIGFVDAFISGFLIAWLYNLFGCCRCIGGETCKKCEPTEVEQTKSEQ